MDWRPSHQLGVPAHRLGAQQPILPHNQGKFHTMPMQILFTIYNALTVLAKNLPSLKAPRMAAMLTCIMRPVQVPLHPHSPLPRLTSLPL